jgi:hypothetical protein
MLYTFSGTKIYNPPGTKLHNPSFPQTIIPTTQKTTKTISLSQYADQSRIQTQFQNNMLGRAQKGANCGGCTSR